MFVFAASATPVCLPCEKFPRSAPQIITASKFIEPPHETCLSCFISSLRDILDRVSFAMSVDRKEPSPGARVEGEKICGEGQEHARPAPLSGIMHLRHTIAQPVFAAFLAGGVAGAVSRTVVSPLERLKILFQIQSAGRTEYKLPVGQGLMKMWRDEGWRGFMRGNGANCIRIIPYSAVQFSSYNFYKKVSRSSQCSQYCCGHARTFNAMLILI